MSDDQIIRHQPRESGGFIPPVNDEESAEAISAHVQRFIGPSPMVFHEIISEIVHIDLLHVPPTAEKPYHTIVTSGMSDKPMTTPPEMAKFQYGELMISLPGNWPMTEAEFKTEQNYWPLGILKFYARMVHQYETWLGWGHTIPNGDPAEPFAPNTKLCCGMLVLPKLTPPGFRTLRVNEQKTINFYAVVPLYKDEMDFKLRQGTEKLEARLQQHRVSELLNLTRENVCKKKLFGLF